MSEGMHYNTAFPGHQIAMPAPLRDGVVKYADGTPGNHRELFARDVTAFLAWAADPKLEERKRLGLMAMLYLAGELPYFYMPPNAVSGPAPRTELSAL